MCKNGNGGDLSRRREILRRIWSWDVDSLRNPILPICDDAFKYYSFVSNPYAFDYYSVLHLPLSSTHKQVEDRYYKLKNEVIKLVNIGFHGAAFAESLLSLAKSNLSDKILRSNFDTKRKDFVFLDWPQRRCSDDNETTAIASSSFKESYLDWKPPVYHVDVIDHMKSAHLHDYDEEEVWVEVDKEEVSVGAKVGSNEEEEEEESDESDDDDEEEEEDEVGEEEESEDKDDDEEEEEDASLSPELRILKKKVFDEMPQNPHYTPLEKYTGKVREGMILGLEVAFTKLCEEIRNLVDVQSFWHGLDGFNEQLSQLKEMGYNVEKVWEKIDILKGIGDGERASRAAVVKIEYEIRDCETVVNVLCSHISDLQAKIEESKNMIANRKSKIETLKKDSCDTMVKFTSAAKSKWGWIL